MASKGIKDALEKAQAKRLDVLGRRATDRGTAAERKASILQVREFPAVAFNPEYCKQFRIFATEAEGRKAKGAAAYRMLRARVLQRARKNGWTAIGVTSPGAGEGKSMTSLNLALTIAREKNNNVFLIDLDMRNPKMCAYLGVKPPAEISAYLEGRILASECLFSIGVDHLALAGTSKPTDAASELLASGRVEELFQFIRNIAPEPLIIADLPPMLSTDDALVVAPKLDATLLVICEGRSRRDGAAKALELLSEYNLAGIVLNRSSAVVSDYYSK